MNKQALLDRIDVMIKNQEEHLIWLESKRLSKIGNWFWPHTNKMIDQFLKEGTELLSQLKQIKQQYENYDFNS
jgi:hypothetical protein